MSKTVNAARRAVKATGAGEEMTERRIVYTYLPDPRNPERRLTIARQKTDNPEEIKFQVALNKPQHRIYRDEGDQFTKRMGRNVAAGRLSKRPMTTLVPEHKTTLRAILEALRTSKVHTIRRIARHYLQD